MDAIVPAAAARLDRGFREILAMRLDGLPRRCGNAPNT